MFTEQDIQTIERKGLTLKDAETHLHYFSAGFPPLDISGPAVPGNGIVQLDGQIGRAHV